MSLPRLYRFVHEHGQVCVEIDESAQPVQICAQAGKPVTSVAKKGWFADARLGGWSACHRQVAAHHDADADHAVARPPESDCLFSEAGIILHFLRRQCP